MIEDPAGMIESLVTASKSRQSLMEAASLLDQFSREDVDAAITYVLTHGDHSAYHLLFALRRRAEDAYDRLPPEVKVNILRDALKHLHYLNDWGYLDPKGSHDGEAAQALLKLGHDALQPLVLLIDDGRPVRLFGSEAATIARMYQYRTRDFAYRYLYLILGRQPVFDPDPQVRDAEIERLKTELQREK